MVSPTATTDDVTKAFLHIARQLYAGNTESKVDRKLALLYVDEWFAGEASPSTLLEQLLPGIVSRLSVEKTSHREYESTLGEALGNAVELIDTNAGTPATTRVDGGETVSVLNAIYRFDSQPGLTDLFENPKDNSQTSNSSR